MFGAVLCHPFEVFESKWRIGALYSDRVAVGRDSNDVSKLGCSVFQGRIRSHRGKGGRQKGEEDQGN